MNSLQPQPFRSGRCRPGGFRSGAVSTPGATPAAAGEHIARGIGRARGHRGVGEDHGVHGGAGAGPPDRARAQVRCAGAACALHPRCRGEMPGDLLLRPAIALPLPAPPERRAAGHCWPCCTRCAVARGGGDAAGSVVACLGEGILAGPLKPRLARLPGRRHAPSWRVEQIHKRTTVKARPKVRSSPVKAKRS